MDKLLAVIIRLVVIGMRMTLIKLIFIDLLVKI